MLGVVAERVHDADPDRPDLAGLPAGRALALATPGMLVATTGEAGSPHLRGAFQNPAIVVPVSRLRHPRREPGGRRHVGPA